MAADPRLRASDEDRDRTAALLREHHALGRLTAEEFGERLDKAFEAKTIGELEKLLSDLPAIDLYRLPGAKLTRQPRQTQVQPARSHGSGVRAWRSAWGSWFTVTLICFVAWALSGGGYPWPLWIAGPWAACLAVGWVTYGAARSSRRQLGPGEGQGQLPDSQRPKDEKPLR